MTSHPRFHKDEERVLTLSQTLFVLLTTISSVLAVDDIVDNEKSVEKRSAENSDGRNLLMAYLGNVGGYDREYRSAEDENKPGSDHSMSQSRSQDIL